jgi:uncharacterized protein YgbK (DUF1537 family)
MPLVVIFADDMTGAADTAAAFAASGLTAAVTLRSASAASADVLACNLATRLQDPTRAMATTARAIKAALATGTPHLYRKIDSTLRGHVGTETRETLSAVERHTGRAPFAVACPAFPAAGRTVLAGLVQVNGRPGHREGRTGRDSITRCLGRAGLRVRQIPLAVVRAGAPDLATAFTAAIRTGADVVAPDAENDADLAVVATAGAVAAARLAGRPLVWVGSAGLARQLPGALGLRGGNSHRRTVVPRHGPALTVTGTQSLLAHAQHRRLITATGATPIELAPEMLLAGEAGTGWALAQQELAAALRAGDVSVTIGQETGVPPDRAAELTRGLGRFVAGHVPGVAMLAVTGGETAQAILVALAVDGVDVLGELEPGIALIATAGRPVVPMATKAGGFGDEETWPRCIAQVLARGPAGLAGPAPSAGPRHMELDLSPRDLDHLNSRKMTEER